jgi:hypothetical protein
MANAISGSSRSMAIATKSNMKLPRLPGINPCIMSNSSFFTGYTRSESNPGPSLNLTKQLLKLASSTARGLRVSGVKFPLQRKILLGKVPASLDEGA